MYSYSFKDFFDLIALLVEEFPTATNHGPSIPYSNQSTFMSKCNIVLVPIRLPLPSIVDAQAGAQVRKLP